MAVIIRHLILTALTIPILYSFSLSQSNKDCLECHKDKKLVKYLESGQEKSLNINFELYNSSIHQKLSCVSCHSDITSLPHSEKIQNVNCAKCHQPEYKNYENSIHGKSFLRGDLYAPTCITCHDYHYDRKKDQSESRINPINLMKVCVECHTNPQITSTHKLADKKFILEYENSAHGKALKEKGLQISATCSDCHGSHQILPPDDPDSSIQKPHIPKTCSKCHILIFNEYNKSIHGKALAKNITEVPVCTDCHGIHYILSHEKPESKVYSKNIPKTCSSCHEEISLVTKFNMPGRRYETYLNSYHGIINKYGKAFVANCASCHGIHNILPQSDPESTVNKSNLIRTCGKCHPGANEKFTMGAIHVLADKNVSPGVYYVRKFYTFFIGILMVLFIIYMIIEIVGIKSKKKKRL